jgi:hypothetical protein
MSVARYDRVDLGRDTGRRWRSLGDGGKRGSQRGFVRLHSAIRFVGG